MALHAAAAASAWMSMPAPYGGFVAAALVALGAFAARGRALLGSSASVRALELGPGPELVFELASGARFKAKLGERRYVSRIAVALPVFSAGRGGHRTIFVTRDMLDLESFRTLRIWALWGRLPGVAAAQLQS
jgi:hypothetical protein